MSRKTELALALAAYAHEGQKDKAGADYIEHPKAVAANFTDEDRTIVALLHDVLEDTDISEMVIQELFGDTVLSALECLTHEENEEYLSYVLRAIKNPIARDVKKADLLHNMDLARLPEVDIKDISRLENKYIPALKVIKKYEATMKLLEGSDIKSKPDFVLTKKLDRSISDFFARNIRLLRAIHDDEEMGSWFRNYYGDDRHKEIVYYIEDKFMKEGYESGVVIGNYGEILETVNKDQIFHNPTKEWAMTLNKKQIIACVAYHFRADHFDNGSLMCESVGEGKLLPLFEAYLEKCGIEV